VIGRIVRLGFRPLVGLGNCLIQTAAPGRIVHRRLRAIYPDVVGRLIAAAERSALPAEA